jgi:hypothetical protein
MSTAWIWTLWAAAMVTLSGIALVYDLGTYEVLIFMAAGIVVSALAYMFDPARAEATR